MVRDDIVELSKVVKELLVILLVSTSIVFAVLSIIDIPHSDFLSTADTVPDFLSWILAFFVRCGMVLPSH